MKECLVKTAFHSALLVAAFLVTMEVIFPLQVSFLPDLQTTAMLFYLPFGIRVISAFFEGWRSIPFLLPGAFIGNWIYFASPFTSDERSLTILIVYTIPPAIFFLIDWLTQTDRRNVTAKTVAWRTLLVGGVFSSLIASLLVHVLVYHQMPRMDLLESSMIYVLGDISGLALLLIILSTAFSLRRQQRH